MREKILVTGCAGFIGSVVTETLVNNGYEVVGVDNFQSSYPIAVHPKIKFYEANIGGDIFRYIMEDELPDIVCHLAAESIIGKANNDPYPFFRDNVTYGINVLEAMRNIGCKNLIMSSTGSTYGEPKYIPMDEQHPQNPINAYGESKYLFERIIDWYVRSYNFRCIMFRYYNVGGATEMNGERRKDETRLVPIALKSAYYNSPMSIFGKNFPTMDGTAVRDYLHVEDVAQAHLLAIQKLEETPYRIYNLGSEEGFTVLQIINEVSKVTGLPIQFAFTNPRPGDPSVLIASNRFAKEDLGWNPKKSNLHQIVVDSNTWFRKMYYIE